MHRSLNADYRENYTQSVTDRTRKRDILAKRKDVSRRFSHWLPSKSTLTKTNTVKLTKKIRLWQDQEEIDEDHSLQFYGGWLRSRTDLRQNSYEQSLTSQVDFGWALWKTQKAAAFSQKAKNYLLDVCWTGEETGKATSSNVAKYRI